MTIFPSSPLGQKRGKPIRDRKHIEAVKALPCIVCDTPPPSDAHHVICGRYGQRRAGDDETIPLCKRHHQWGPEAIHENKRAWVERHGPDHGYLDEVRRMLEANKREFGR